MSNATCPTLQGRGMTEFFPFGTAYPDVSKFTSSSFEVHQGCIFSRQDQWNKDFIAREYPRGCSLVSVVPFCPTLTAFLISGARYTHLGAQAVLAHERFVEER